jgi:hypothetical protein
MIYLVIANPHAIATHTETGVVVSRHRTIDAARDESTPAAAAPDPRRVQLSISSGLPCAETLRSLDMRGLLPAHVGELAYDLARSVLERQGQLLYGGRPDNGRGTLADELARAASWPSWPRSPTRHRKWHGLGWLGASLRSRPRDVRATGGLRGRGGEGSRGRGRCWRSFNRLSPKGSLPRRQMTFNLVWRQLESH